MQEPVKINREQRLYVIPCGAGYSCLGFDVAKRKTQAVADWLKRPDLAPPPCVGTLKAWAAYQAAMREGAAHNRATGQRCEADLEPRLRGLERRRVEVTSADGTRRRFWVGKSTGWSPVHLEIARRSSTGGPGVCLMDSDTVRVVA